MKTTLEIPDELFREAKLKAASEGRRFKDLVAEGLRLRLNQAPQSSQTPVQFPMIKSRGNRRLNIPDDIASHRENVFRHL